jgi:site-specific recombinase XerD
LRYPLRYGGELVDADTKGGVFVCPKAMPLLKRAIDAFVIDGKSRRLSTRTLESYTFHLTRFADWCASQQPVLDLADVTQAALRRYLTEQNEQGLRAWTVYGSASTLRVFWRWCINETLVTVNPMHRVKMPKLPKEILPAFSEDDVTRILDACKTHRDRAIVLFLLDTGVRRSEVAALTPADVDMTQRRAIVRDGKGAKDRAVFFGDKTHVALQRYLTVRRLPAGAPLFGLTAEGLRGFLQRLGRQAGVEHCSPHTFRRTFALWSLRAGMDVHRLARLMGHEQVETLRSYLALVEDDIRTAHAEHGAVDTYLK